MFNEIFRQERFEIGLNFLVLRKDAYLKYYYQTQLCCPENSGRPPGLRAKKKPSLGTASFFILCRNYKLRRAKVWNLHFLHLDGIHTFKTALYLKSDHIVFRDFFSQAVDMYKIFLLGIDLFYKPKAF